MTICARRLPIALVGGLLGASALTSWPAQAGTLVDELSQILLSHPQIEGGRENVAAAEEGVSRAFGDFLPEARLNSSYGYEHINSPGRRAAAGGRPFEIGKATQATVTVTQTVFSGFRVESAHESAKAQKTVAEAQLEGGTQAVMLEATNAYLEVLRNIRLIKLAQDTEANIMRQLDLEDERVRRGSGITVDVLQAKSRLQIAKERRVAFQGALKDSMSRYQQVFDTPPVVNDMVMPTPPITLVPETVDDAITAALAEHPSILAALGQVEVADQARIGARSPFYPQIDLVGSANYEDDFEATNGERRDYR
jgi:adhesin transport system outer membrane protein